MKKLNSNGFTLIELLVVIAIIGILSSVVLASVNTTRDKGADSAIKADLSGVRNQAEIYFDSNSNYGSDFNTNECPVSGSGSGTIFENDEVAARQISDAKIKSGNATTTCSAGNGIGSPDGSSASSWSISIPLKYSSGSSWCVSSSGYSGLGTAQIDGSFNAVCQ